MHIDLRVPIESEEGQYLVKCARIRDVTVTHLIKRVLTTVAQDQLVAAVLDDDGRRVSRHDRYLHHFREID
jgi:hypothetical protein